jgi:hypothetical protein
MDDLVGRQTDGGGCSGRVGAARRRGSDSGHGWWKTGIRAEVHGRVNKEKEKFDGNIKKEEDRIYMLRRRQ